MQLDEQALSAFRAEVVPCAPAVCDLTSVGSTDRDVPTSSGAAHVRLYRPTGEGPRPLVVYVHGAGWVAGNLDSHDGICRFLSLRLGAVVVAVDYRLAPEHPWPAAFDDVYDVVCWVATHSDEIGSDGRNLVLAGESAGAHLVAATALRARDAAGPAITQQVLLYALLDGSTPGWSHFCEAYFPDQAAARSRYGSPVWVDDLAGLPPAFLLYGELEPTRSEQELYAHKLAAAGVPVESVCVAGVGHAVYELKAASALENEVLLPLVAGIRRGLDQQASSKPPVTYGSYLKVEELLALQRHTRSSDEHLFVVVHQAHELWFRLAIVQIEVARDALSEGDLEAATRHLRRVTEIFRLLTAHWAVLSTLTPSGYLSFRGDLGGGSGFQSTQFRELEFLCGLKDDVYLDRMALTVDERHRLEERLRAASLSEVVDTLLARIGVTPEVVLTDPDVQPRVFALLEGLMDLDEGMAAWRGRHTLLVERQIGHKPGTGGTSGVGYLRAAAEKRLFPALWAARCQLPEPTSPTSPQQTRSPAA